MKPKEYVECSVCHKRIPASELLQHRFSEFNDYNAKNILELFRKK